MKTGKNKLKLNIGCGCTPEVGYINIDNGQDYQCQYNPSDTRGFTEMQKIAKNMGLPYKTMRLMDANNLMFDDETFDEIMSVQCVGEYVKNYEEILRTLKPDGILKITVHNCAVFEIIFELAKRNMRCTSFRIINYGPEGSVEMLFERANSAQKR